MVKLNITRHLVNQRQLLMTGSLGVLLLILPLVLVFVDPILLISKYKLRVTKGSMIHELLLSEMKGARLEVYLFNVTNPGEFLDGSDYKMKLKEVGPFVYQEYRRNEKVEFDTDAQVVRFVPRMRTEFVPEESIGDPKDVILNLPNVPLMGSAAYVSPYSFLVRQMYNMIVGSFESGAFVKIDAYSFLWKYEDPIVALIKKTMPGLVYYDRISILERLYDDKVYYTLEMGTSGEDVFKVKTVTKARYKQLWENDTLVDRKTAYNNTYEGVAFPPGLNPGMPVNLYRLGICKNFKMQYTRHEYSNIGTKTLVYQIDKDTYVNKGLCYSNGECPYGLIDLSSCWYNFAVAVSNAHFLDADPKLMDRIEGLNPDREKHSSYIKVVPEIGLTTDSYVALQLNVVLGDVSFNSKLRRFSNLVVPVAHVRLTLPELPEQTKSSLSLMYVTGPRILLGVQIACCVLGALLLVHSIRLVYCNWLFTNKRRGIVFNPPLRAKVSAEMPLVH